MPPKINARCFRIQTGSSHLLKGIAQELQSSAAEGWKWNGRNVFIADGSHVSMPDTLKNQACYPQPPTQKPGLGFPLARITVLLSLATAPVMIWPSRGACRARVLRNHSLSRMYDALKPGDVVLADALFDNYFLVSDLRDRGIDLVAA